MLFCWPTLINKPLDVFSCSPPLWFRWVVKTIVQCLWGKFSGSAIARWLWWSSSAGIGIGIHSSSGCSGHCWLYMPLSTLFVVPPIERRRLWSGGQFKAPNELLTQLVCSFLNGFDYSAYFLPSDSPIRQHRIHATYKDIKPANPSRLAHIGVECRGGWSRSRRWGRSLNQGAGSHPESRRRPLFDRLLMMMTIVSWC